MFLDKELTTEYAKLEWGEVGGYTATRYATEAHVTVKVATKDGHAVLTLRAEQGKLHYRLTIVGVGSVASGTFPATTAIADSVTAEVAYGVFDVEQVAPTTGLVEFVGFIHMTIDELVRWAYEPLQ